MEFVMVPVPEELAERVLTYVSWKNAEAKAEPPVNEQPDVGEAVARAFARLDDPSRALVTTVAAATVDGEELTIPEAARRAGVTTREAVSILLEVNNVVQAAGGPPLGFHGRDRGGSAGDGMWGSHVVVIAKGLAGPILESARSRASG